MYIVITEVDAILLLQGDKGLLSCAFMLFLPINDNSVFFFQFIKVFVIDVSSAIFCLLINACYVVFKACNVGKIQSHFVPS